MYRGFKLREVKCITDLECVTIPAPQHTVCIHLKTSCKAGPYLNPKKLKEAVTIMGPLTPDAALKKLLECIVHSSHKSRQVLDILSNERDKKTFWSILQV